MLRPNIGNAVNSLRRTATRLRFRAAFLLIIGCLPLRSHPQSSSKSSVSKPDWLLTWSDEFNGPHGSAPDPSKWVVESGGNGWGNKELEYYEARGKNVRQENGNLVIAAIKEKFTGPDGVVRNYTSARLKTQGHFSQKYGRFEARIKVPHGRGLWPAFWLLGDDFSSVGWPTCGEIDIMENGGSQPAMIRGSLHGPGYSAENAMTGTFTFPNVQVGDGFHVFAAEWEAERVRFYVDGELYATKTPKDLPAGKRWVFDHPFFIILNLAVGGNLPGNPEDSTMFPQRMLVDYVRVYSRR